MQSASSVNHTGEGNRLCNEISISFLFSKAFSFFVSCFLLMSYGTVRVCTVTHSSRCSSPGEVKGNRFDFRWNSIRHHFQSTTLLLINARGRDVLTMSLRSGGGWKERNSLRWKEWAVASMSSFPLCYGAVTCAPAACVSWKEQHYYQSWYLFITGDNKEIMPKVKFLRYGINWELNQTQMNPSVDKVTT